VAGFAKGGRRRASESESPDVTILHYEVDAQIGGKLAQLGQRLDRFAGGNLPANFSASFPALLSAGEAEAPWKLRPRPKGWWVG